jgi:hypothetical protein
MAKNTLFGLGAMLGSAGVSGFHAFDPLQSYVCHGPLQRLAGLAKIPELQHPEALIKAWRGFKVSAWPSAPMQSQRSFHVLPEQLESAFKYGFTLYFRLLETNVPALIPLLRQLESDLCLATGTITCEAFASRAGTGARMHFDPNMTFNIQVVGQRPGGSPRITAL